MYYAIKGLPFPGQDPPSETNVGICNATCQATAPVTESAGDVTVDFNYSADVNILVGVLSEDFTQVWWLNDSCEFTTDYTQAATNMQTLACTVTLPGSAENGWLFWLVTAEDIASLDWMNSAYDLLFYQSVG